MLSLILDKPGIDFSALLRKLMMNDDFRMRFVARFMELRDEVFEPKKALSLLNDMTETYRPLMKEQVKRNGPSWAAYFNSPENYFYYNIDVIKTWLRGRYKYSEEMLRAHFDVDAELAAYEAAKEAADA